jgi:hypothetical protein
VEKLDKAKAGHSQKVLYHTHWMFSDLDQGLAASR